VNRFVDENSSYRRLLQQLSQPQTAAYNYTVRDDVTVDKELCEDAKRHLSH
jgi:hypothetical protein